jgi:two-component system response regulator YesN
MEKVKVILVDDEKYAIEGLKNMLNWKAFDGELIGTAANGKEAIDIITTNKPDVIISDIKMPIMDGLELAKWNDEQKCEIHLILLSGHGEFQYAQKAIQYKVKDYILKPVTRDKITQLEQLLIDINKSKQTKKKEFLSIWDTSLQEEIIEALRQSDRKTFDELFKSEFFISNMSSNDSSNATGIQLLNFLYQYLMEIQINKDILKASKSNAMDEYWELPNKEEKINYLITRFYDVLMSVDEQKQSNVDAISTYARRYVEQHYTEPDFNISYLADEMNVSLSYLSTVFKQTMGTNLSTYITSLRINSAKELLQDIKYAISDVASLSGYEDSRYFAKLFKKKLNMTPTEYRNLVIQKDNLL